MGWRASFLFDVNRRIVNINRPMKVIALLAGRGIAEVGSKKQVGMEKGHGNGHLARLET